MTNPHLHPLAAIAIAPHIATLPKADIHIHQEWSPRLDRVLAKRQNRQSYDWRKWVEQIMEAPPGMRRLAQISSVFPVTPEQDRPSEMFVARLEDLLKEAAHANAILVEVRVGKDIFRPDCIALFREAEKRVQQQHPHLLAEVIPTLVITPDSQRLENNVRRCLELSHEGVYGVDILYPPFDREVDWRPIYHIAERFAAAGIGLTVHVGEISTFNIAAALQIPGLTRLGHCTHAVHDARLLDLIANSSVTIECALSCNVILGAAPSYQEHPIRTFVEREIPVTLCTDDPVQMCTTIEREYMIGHMLGFTTDDLLNFTRSAINAAFITAERRNKLLRHLARWRTQHVR